MDIQSLLKTHKARIQSVLFIGLAYLAFTLFQANYKISYSQKAVYSLPHGLYLTEFSDTFERGDVVAFVLEKDRVIHKKGTNFAKIAAGVPGDKVTVDEYVVTVETPEGDIKTYPVDMPYLTQKAGVPIEDYLKTYEVKEGEWFSLGTHRLSVDSKLFGMETTNKIVGVNYAIW
nr:S26 family signal peptidase [Alteromonas macleodii]|tara:strand:- start:26009 stop:26530 length:522 start_codon:yes stop_codon:yes gene_type:complete